MDTSDPSENMLWTTLLTPLKKNTRSSLFLKTASTFWISSDLVLFFSRNETTDQFRGNDPWSLEIQIWLAIDH